MHIDSCPKCGSPGYLIKTHRRIGGKIYGPYLVVQHYVSKSKEGTTRVRPCFISLKKLHPNEKTRIGRLLDQDGVARSSTETIFLGKSFVRDFAPRQPDGSTPGRLNTATLQ